MVFMFVDNLNILVILGVELFSFGVGDLYYGNNEEDLLIFPTLTLLNFPLPLPFSFSVNIYFFQDDDEEELEDMIIHPTDSVIVCARNEDDISLLEVTA